MRQLRHSWFAKVQRTNVGILPSAGFWEGIFPADKKSCFTELVTLQLLQIP